MRMSSLNLALLVGFVLCDISVAAPPTQLPFASDSRASDISLDSMRGGVLLPNGLDVAIGIDIQTRVNGELALHTVLSTEAPNPYGLRVLVDGNESEPMPAGVTVQPQASPGQVLIIDRRGAGTTLMPSRTWTPGTSVRVVNAPREVWPAYAGESELDVAAGGPAVATDLGNVRVDRDDAGATVTLSSDTLVVQHLLGQATGVVVANTANDQSIDTISAIDVDLQGAWPIITNAIFAVGAIAADAAARN